MTITRSILALALVLAPAAVGCSHDDDHSHHPAAHARTSGAEHAQHADHPNGTRVATVDRDGNGTADGVAVVSERPTALDQGESASDIEITRQIRSAVVDDSSLSFGARNCVIVTRNGDVTLRGDVTGTEAAAIERHAMAVAGVTHVENELHVTNTASTD
jgi:osmotically-inducible protein OsmY